MNSGQTALDHNVKVKKEKERGRVSYDTNFQD